MPHTQLLFVTSALGRSTEDKAEAVPLAYVHSIPDLPPDPFAISNTSSFEDLIQFVYPDILDGDPIEFKTRAILSSTNATIDTINEHVLNMLPGELLAAYSCDAVDPDACGESSFEFLASTDLNAITQSGVPPHCLHLKIGAMVMITRPQL